MDEQWEKFYRAWSEAAQVPLHMILPQWFMRSAALTLGMFLMWAWVDEATFDGRTFRYGVRLDGEIQHVAITGTVGA